MEKISIWNERRNSFVPPLNHAILLKSCIHPLKETKATVVYARRRLMAKANADGTMGGAEVDLLKALVSKYGMTLEFVQARQNNLKLSTHDKLVIL